MKTPSEYKNMEYRWLLVELAKMFKPEVYVELGVKKGYTFNEMAKVVKRAIGIDKRIEKTVKRADNIKLYNLTTEKFIENWKGQIDFLFIDADHNFLSAWKDFEGLYKWVKFDTGLIFLHDTYPINRELLEKGYCSDCWRTASWIYDLNRTQKINVDILTFPGPWAGLTIVRKRAYGRHGWMDDGEKNPLMEIRP